MESEWRREDDWYWEGNIHSRVLEYMQEEEGFGILSRGEPTPAEQGVEIVAEGLVGSQPVHRLVSVRGWPSATHTRGAQVGQPRSTRPEVIARGWVAQAMLDLALGRGADPDVDLCLALPAMASYIRYLQRLRWFLAAARASVYLVTEDGRVTTTPPGAPPVSVAPLPPGEIGKRRKLGLPGSSRLHLPLLHTLITAGGMVNRADAIVSVARWFPEVPQPPPPEFGQRVSVAQHALQEEGLTELESRGLWRITPAGHTVHATQWEDWLRRHEP